MWKALSRFRIILIAVTCMLIAPLAQAQILFQDNFERGDLDQWVAKGSSHHGQIVPDPLDPTGTNHALNFTARNSGGDIFTGSAIDISGVTGTIVLSFDYLGLADGDRDPNNLGGFIGISRSEERRVGRVGQFRLVAP